MAKRFRWIVERRRQSDDVLVDATPVNMTTAEVRNHITRLTDATYFTTAIKAGTEYANLTGRGRAEC